MKTLLVATAAFGIYTNHANGMNYKKKILKSKYLDQRKKYFKEIKEIIETFIAQNNQLISLPNSISKLKI